MIKKIKILHILKSNSFSGAENVAITICRNLDDKYEYAYASSDGPIAEWLQRDNIQYCKMKNFSMGELHRVLREYQPDIVHAHDFSASIYSACSKKGFRLISHLHNNPPWICRWNLKSLVYRVLRNRMDCILLVSKAIEEEAVFLSKNANRIDVIGNPIDSIYIEDMARQYEVKPFELLFLGRITEQKNPQRFIRVVEELYKQGLAIHAFMIGDGNLMVECKMLIRELGLENVIEITGFCQNPYPYIQNAQLMLVTSDWEGYGLVAVEALMLGTPVLARNVGGLKSIFEGIPYALCESQEEFCEKAREMLQNPNSYNNYKKAIENKKAEICNLKKYMNKIENIYRELMG